MEIFLESLKLFKNASFREMEMLRLLSKLEQQKYKYSKCYGSDEEQTKTAAAANQYVIHSF